VNAIVEYVSPSALTVAWVRMSYLTMVDAINVPEKSRVTDQVDANLTDLKTAARGDGEAYARVIRRHQQLVARRMTRFTRDPRAIEELVHDVFVEAYFGLKNYRGDAPFEHWLQRIATRVGYRYWTRQGHDRKYESIGLLEPEAENGGGSLDDRDEVAAALEKLSARDRLVLTLLYLESCSVAEAADLAGWSESMVKVQAHRARRRLRALLEPSPIPLNTENDNG
jgi:RNA polymerase sigma-70 factor (ECF subfamily)